MTEQPQPMSVADFRRFLADRETPKRPDLARAVAEFPDANLVVPVLNPIQALAAKRELEAAGRAVFVVNDYQRTTPAEQKARTEKAYADAAPGSAALVLVAPWTPTARHLLETDAEARAVLDDASAGLGL